MSNQRPGKTYRAAATDDRTEAQLIRYLTTVAQIASDYDMTDLEVFAENAVQDLRDGKPIPTDLHTISKQIGV